MNLWALTDKGLVRKQNEDTYFSYCDEERGITLILVCDGMGGARAGSVASSMASGIFVDEVKKGLDGVFSASRLQAVLKNAAAFANRVVYDAASENDGYVGMGTTLVAALIVNDMLLVLNIGDSRAYRIQNGQITQLTRDHSVVEDLVERGELSREESRNHPRKNLITRALGTSPDIEADVFVSELQRGEYILLCSDGLSNVIEDREILREILAGPDDCCERLFKLALERGAPDNFTVVLYRS